MQVIPSFFVLNFEALFFTCNCELLRTMQKGDALNWDKAKWDIVNMTAEYQDVATVCKPIRPGHVILPEKRNFTSHTTMCKKLRGKTTVVRDLQTQLELSDELNQYEACSFNSSMYSLLCCM